MKNSSLGATGAMKAPPMLVPFIFLALLLDCLVNFFYSFYCFLTALFSDLDSFPVLLKAGVPIVYGTVLIVSYWGSKYGISDSRV